MLGRLLVLSMLALAAPTVGAAGSEVVPLASSAASAGPVTITDGPSSWTGVDADGPTLDFDQHGAAGLATGMQVVIGDPAAPADDHAFALEHTGEEPAIVSVQYRYTDQPPSPAGVSFSVVRADGTVLAAGDGASMPAFTLGPGESAYVLVTIDTSGTTPSDDLSGTLTVAVTSP